MLKKFFDTLANMGIWIRLNDSRTEPPAEDGRVWGSTVEGFAISLAPLHEDSISVLIKNGTNVEKRVRIPGWLTYVKVHVTAPDGSEVPLKPYGKQILEAPQTSQPVERDFLPGRYLSTDIPLGALYELNSPGPHRVTVSCPVPGHPVSNLTSNEVTLP
jgi:hypothetical protein